ncbi:MAG: hypothetical protein AAB316_05420, partial [Bacteroidota bacterium]
KAIGWHTLTIDLLAKNLSATAGRYSLDSLVEDLKNRGVFQLSRTRSVNSHYLHGAAAKPEAVLRSLYDLADLGSSPNSPLGAGGGVGGEWLLLQFAVLPAKPFDLARLGEMLAVETKEEDDFDAALASLTRLGWLEQSEASPGKPAYFLHPVLQEIVRDKMPPALDDKDRPDCRRLINFLLSRMKKYDEGKLDNDLAAAAEWLEEAASLADSLPADSDEVGDLCFYVSDTCSATGRLPDAQRFMEKSAAHYERREKAARGGSEWEFYGEKLSVRLERIGKTWQSLGKLDKALEYFEKRSKLGEELSAANPRSESLKNGLAISYYKLAGIYEAKGDLAKAFEYYSKDTQLTEEAWQNNPHSAQLKKYVAISYRQMSSILKKMGKQKEAAAWFSKADDVK